MSRPLRVLFASDGVFPHSMGGMQRHSRHLPEHLAEIGVQVAVIHPHAQRVFSNPAIVELPIVPTRRRGPGHYVRELGDYARNVAEIVEREASSYDVVYGQGATLMSYLPARTLPCIVNPHGLEMLQPFGVRERLTSIAFRRVLRRSVANADRVVSLGGQLTEMLQSFGVPATTIIERPNAVAVERVDGMRRQVARVPGSLLFIGRLAPNKGLPQLLEAAERLGKTANIMIAGDGPQRAMVESAASRGVVTYLGRLSDEELFQRLSQVEALVLPTRGEGMPTVVLEAMACETPVIVSGVGAVRAMVDDRNGIVVEPGSTDALESAIRRFLSAPANARRAMGENGRARVLRDFDWPVVAARTIDDLHATIDAFSRSRRNRGAA